MANLDSVTCPEKSSTFTVAVPDLIDPSQLKPQTWNINAPCRTDCGKYLPNDDPKKPGECSIRVMARAAQSFLRRQLPTV